MVWVSGVKLDISIILIVVMFSGAYTSVKTLNMLRLLYADYTLIKLFKIKADTLRQRLFG